MSFVSVALLLCAACASSTSGEAMGTGGPGVVGTGGVANSGKEAWEQFDSCEIHPAITLTRNQYGALNTDPQSFLALLRNRTAGKYHFVDRELYRSWEYEFVLRKGTQGVPVVQLQWVDHSGSTAGEFREETYPEPQVCELESAAFLQDCVDDATPTELGKCFRYDPETRHYAPTFFKDCRPATVGCH